MSDLERLRAESEALAAELPELSGLVRQQATAHPGGAPRQKAGHGEDFWQYRSQTPEDSAGAIDWRRSATGDEFYIREHELQTAQLLEVWVDPSPGFDWKSEDQLLTKADEARVLTTAIALRFSEEGDLTAALGGVKAPARANRAADYLLSDSVLPNRDLAPPPSRRDASFAILASDFYGDIGAIERWVLQSAGKSIQGILLQVCDPLETSFPFQGRMKFTRPGGKAEKIFGRVEGLRDDYLERFEARQTQIAELARRVGWTYRTHVTGEPRRGVCFDLMNFLAATGGGK